MANEVFANTREISCKSGDAKSICEFPDVCMTPPTSPATPMGVPVPYPNTAFSRDTANGSKTVKIDQKEIMLQHKSYYKTSTGDEAGCATPAKKGIITGKIKGKMYFISWSMDVKIEGKNVVRTADMTTHNHASDPPNGAVPTGNIEGVALPRPNTDEKCKLRPYSKGCSEGETPHHCVPDHCFKQKGKDGEYYDGAISHKDGLCICVSGSTKSSTPSGKHVKKKDFKNSKEHYVALAEHGRIHNKFDKMERELGNAGNPKNTATLGDLETKAAECIEQVTGCDKDHLKKQMRKHHLKHKLKASTKLRADPYGRRTNPPAANMGVTPTGTAPA